MRQKSVVPAPRSATSELGLRESLLVVVRRRDGHELESRVAEARELRCSEQSRHGTVVLCRGAAADEAHRPADRRSIDRAPKNFSARWRRRNKKTAIMSSRPIGRWAICVRPSASVVRCDLNDCTSRPSPFDSRYAAIASPPAVYWIGSATC
jgi:hypothetical protein